MVPPNYPNFVPLAWDHRQTLGSLLSQGSSGISEFTFAGLYLFRATYQYRVCLAPDGSPIVAGEKGGQRFVLLPLDLPELSLLEDLLNRFDSVKNLSRAQAERLRPLAETQGWSLIPDRDNWDYLYDTREMATLTGKRFHKKRNLIHQFEHLYGSLEHEPLSVDNTPDALQVLQTWLSQHPGVEHDLDAAREGLERGPELGLDGWLFRYHGRPVAYVQGEPSPGTQAYIIHFEKANAAFKGIYQVVFRDFAQGLIGRFPRINREQDLGDPGLRQAKETYRPVGFVEKFRLTRLGPPEATKM